MLQNVPRGKNILRIRGWVKGSKSKRCSQSFDFSSSVRRWELEHKEGWVPKNWCFWIVVLEETLESPLDGKEIKPVNPKGNSEYSLEGLMLKLKLQYFGQLMGRADSLEKTMMLGKIEGRKRKGWQRMRWCHWLSGHYFEQTAGDTEGQGSLVCCSPQGCKESDMTQQLNNKSLGTCVIEDLTFFIWIYLFQSSIHAIVCYCSVAPSCPTLPDPVDCSTLGFPVHHHLLELTQIHVRWDSDAIQPSQSYHLQWFWSPRK